MLYCNDIDLDELISYENSPLKSFFGCCPAFYIIAILFPEAAVQRQSLSKERTNGDDLLKSVGLPSMHMPH